MQESFGCYCCVILGWYPPPLLRSDNSFSGCKVSDYISFCKIYRHLITRFFTPNKYSEQIKRRNAPNITTAQPFFPNLARSRRNAHQDIFPARNPRHEIPTKRSDRECQQPWRFRYPLPNLQHKPSVRKCSEVPP